MGQQLENPPAPQVVGKAMRLTRAKGAALDALANLGSNYVEWGTPPCAVSLLAAEMDVDQPSMQEQRRLGADILPRVRVAAEKRRLERLAQIHGMSRKTAAQIAKAFFAGATQPEP